METPIRSERGVLTHLPVLDGWRAFSIALVLAGHLLPIGPRAWGLNGPIAAVGMVIFFTLSGFLITRFLIEDGNIRRFLIRRLMRIVPLGWLGIALAFLLVGDGNRWQLISNLLFVANIPPFGLIEPGAHFWSLCMEVQFYLSIGLLAAFFGKRALFVIPVACVATTIARVYFDQPMTIITWFRIDEILAGASLALVYEGLLGTRARSLVSRGSLFIVLPLVFASADLRTGYLPFLRPYLSAYMVGASLYSAPTWLMDACRWRAVVYTAQVSYALYVFHGIFAHSWLGTGETLVKYGKRPLLLAATFACAHLSTFHYERRFNALGRKWAERKSDTVPAAGTTA